MADAAKRKSTTRCDFAVHLSVYVAFLLAGAPHFTGMGGRLARVMA